MAAPITLSADLVSWSKLHGVVEASTLFGRGDMPSRFALHSPRTNDTVEFELRARRRDSDGEIAAWRYDAVSTARGLSVTVLND